jgi:hypothetical protein
MFLLLAACETAETAPAPPPVPPPPVDAAPPPVDAAPPAIANLDCYVSGPKEYTKLATDPATMTGVLDQITTGKHPGRHIKYAVRPEGPGTYALVFDSYLEGDYRFMFRKYPGIPPRENMQKGKSIIARVFLRDSHTFMVGVDADLATAMSPKWPGNEMPCWEGR